MGLAGEKEPCCTSMGLLCYAAVTRRPTAKGPWRIPTYSQAYCYFELGSRICFPME